MNKAIMIAIQPKWCKMIIDGIKKLEFRPYGIPKGTKVYLYESLGKQKLCATTTRHLCKAPLEECASCYKKYYEGKGKVVAEFVVGECYEIEDDTNIDGTPNSETRCLTKTSECGYHKDTPLLQLQQWGYTNQRYAMTITDLIVYDEPIPVTEFIGWNKVREKVKSFETFMKVKKMKNGFIKDCKLTNPPQGRVFVVEREDM